jgi:hypothetical protein
MIGDPPNPKPTTNLLLTAKVAAHRLRVSTSWLAKARMRGDGPPYLRIGRSIRYAEAAFFGGLIGIVVLLLLLRLVAS